MKHKHLKVKVTHMKDIADMAHTNYAYIVYDRLENREPAPRTIERFHDGVRKMRQILDEMESQIIV